MPVIAALLALTLVDAPAEPPPPVGRKLADFTRTDAVSGKPWVLADAARDAKATVLVFLNTGCPVSNSYAPRLAKLHDRYAPEGVVFVGVNSIDLDTAADVAKSAKQLGLPFPVVKDEGTALADKLAVDRVPTAVVLDAGRNVRYAGRIDDQFAPGVAKNKAGSRELGAAIDAVLDGRQVTKPFVAAAGCKLTRDKTPVKAASISYHKDVAPIIQTKCQECHRAGEAGPFTLNGYKQAKGWADMIREVVADGVMPPWHADAPRGHFSNDRRLSDGQKATLLAWVDAGCPEGDPKDAPPPVQWVDGWRLGREPELVVKMEHPVDIPGQYLFGLSGMPYQHIRSGEAFKEDTWIQAVEVRPDYRAVVHHIIVYAFPPGVKIKQDDFAKYMLATYVPGDQAVVYPEGFARKVVKGTRLLFEMHYTPNGKPGRDQSMVGIVKAKGPPKYEVKGDAAFEGRFVIPPGASAHEVTAEHTFSKPVTLTWLSPHMHLRGKAFRYELVTPDGKRQTVLNVPKYDFNWQLAYELAEPLKVPAGSKMHCTAVFDNSTSNPANPNPKDRVRWGDQTWEEMMIGFFGYYEER